MLGFPEHIIMASVFSPRKRNRMFLEHKDCMVLIGLPLRHQQGVSLNPKEINKTEPHGALELGSIK